MFYKSLVSFKASFNVELKFFFETYFHVKCYKYFIRSSNKFHSDIFAKRTVFSFLSSKRRRTQRTADNESRLSIISFAEVHRHVMRTLIRRNQFTCRDVRTYLSIVQTCRLVHFPSRKKIKSKTNIPRLQLPPPLSGHARLFFAILKRKLIVTTYFVSYHKFNLYICTSQ